MNEEELQQALEEEKRKREQEFTKELQELLEKYRIVITPKVIIQGTEVISAIDVRAL